MIAAALHAELERYASTMRHANPLFYKAADGTMTPECISRYLANVHYLIRYTPTYLVRAREAAKARGDLALARHYQERLGEEVDHDKWAEQDLERIAAQVPTTLVRDVMPAWQELVAYLASIIDEDPVLYLSYILFAEQLIAALGPEWLLLLEERCGIPRSSMSVIANHAELDRDHVSDALARIDDLVGDPRKLPRMRQVLLESLRYFDRFCAEVTDTHVRQVSAA